MPAGRPRAFDVDKALDRALQVFWKKGYEGASLPDLTAAMGISRPSLYATFGNKEALFRKAIDRYAAGPAAKLDHALQAPTARKCVEQWFEASLDLVTTGRNPRGCFMVQGALACGEEGAGVQREMAERRADGETALRKRFRRAIAEGDLSKKCNAADLAKFVMSVTHGMAVQAAGGAKRKDLERVAALALEAWPK